MDRGFKTGLGAAGVTLAAVLAAAAATAQAQDKLKIGIVATFSGPPAVLGQQLRNGFQLAVKNFGGRLGDREAEVIVADDELKPDVAVGKVKAFVERDKVDFVVGPIFSNMLQAIMKPVTDSGTILISPNAGTSNYAGKECNANFFVTSYQNDQSFEVLGKYAQDTGIKKLYLMAPNYQAAKPDAIYVFLPGGMGVNFVKQFRQAGLADKTVFLSAFTVDESTLPAQQDAALGFFGGANWAPNLDNPQNKAFVAAYEKEHGAVPGTYAFQSYDAAQLIDSAVRAVKGNLADKDALRAALQKADFKSLRGGFKFNTNHYPIQNFYLVKVAKRPDGKFQTEIAQRVFENYGDPHAKDCPMK